MLNLQDDQPNKDDASTNNISGRLENPSQRGLIFQHMLSKSFFFKVIMIKKCDLWSLFCKNRNSTLFNVSNVNEKKSKNVDIVTN